MDSRFSRWLLPLLVATLGIGCDSVSDNDETNPDTFWLFPWTPFGVDTAMEAADSMVIRLEGDIAHGYRLWNDCFRSIGSFPLQHYFTTSSSVSSKIVHSDSGQVLHLNSQNATSQITTILKEARVGCRTDTPIARFTLVRNSLDSATYSNWESLRVEADYELLKHEGRERKYALTVIIYDAKGFPKVPIRETLLTDAKGRAVVSISPRDMPVIDSTETLFYSVTIQYLKNESKGVTLTAWNLRPVMARYRDIR